MADYEKNDYINFINSLEEPLRRQVYNNMHSLDDISFLDGNIAEGTVLCIPFNKLNNEACHFEVGALIVGPNSSINEHEHDKYIETYTVIGESEVSLNPDSKSNFPHEYFNYCGHYGIHHVINDTDEYVLIIYHKMFF